MPDGRSIHERIDAIEHHLFGDLLHNKVVGEKDPNNPSSDVTTKPSDYQPEESAPADHAAE